MKTKILFLADANSPHTLRWIDALITSGYTIGIFCFYKIEFSLYSNFSKIKFYSLNIPKNIQSTSENNFSKISYLKAVKQLRKIIKDFKPDILHAHYASSYGLIGALSGFHPFIISMWGSDVYSFPNHSILHKNIFKFNLSKADILLSTSASMKVEAEKYTKKEIIVTPFGIDVDRFKAANVNSIIEKGSIVIGTIKSLEKIYGIEFLIEAFKIVKEKYPEKNIKLLVVGEGSQRKNLEALAIELNLEREIVFTGYIKHSEVNMYHNMLDIYVAVSLQESFGVAVLEASACNKPVIVSNVGGLPEVVDNGITGFIVEKENPFDLAEALIKLIDNPNLRAKMGINGRNKVLNEYNWIKSIELMLLIYNGLLKVKSK